MNKDNIFLYQKEYNSSSNIHIAIRSLTLKDINDTYCKWLNDPDTNRYLESRFINWNIEMLENYFHEKEKSEIMLAIIDKNTEIHIGNIKISSIDLIHKRAELGILIGNKEYWGKGIATEAIKLVTNYCFSTLKLHKVTAGAYAENKASIKAFMNNDFIIEGERREHFISQSKWTSAILLGKINHRNHQADI